MNSATRTLFAFAVFSLLAACGLKGPLYLPPPEETEGQQAPKAAPVKQEKPAQKEPQPVSVSKPKAKPAPEAPREEEAPAPETPKDQEAPKQPLKPPPAPSEDGGSLEEPPAFK